MSLHLPAVEYVDRSENGVRYLEHGWPTELCRWHSHAEYELHLIIATRGRTFVGDYIGEFAPGDLFLVGPHVPHNWVTDDAEWAPHAVRDRLVQFGGEGLDQLHRTFPEFEELATLLELSGSGIYFEGFDSEEAEQRLVELRDSHGAARILKLLEFLTRLSEHADQRVLCDARAAQQATSGDERISLVVDHIVENFSEDLTLAQMSEMAGMSQSAFSRNFQKVTGKSFIQFLLRIRIGEACGMLHSTSIPISTICHEVGFQNLSHFNRQFQKLKSMTPSDYRTAARQQHAAARKPARGAVYERR